jgi:2,5-dihydroxypyridine 5,6-dioxygenase
MPTDPTMVALFKAELELCKIGAGDTLAVLSEGEIRADYAAAFLLAARALGAASFNLNVAPRDAFAVEHQHGRNALAGNRPAIEALCRANLVVDLMGLLFSREQDEITAAGARMLLVIEPFNVLQAMFPSHDIRRRVEFGEQLLRRARELRITSEAGTDLHYALGQYPVMTEYGFTDTPGRWDHFPSGFLLTQGNDGAVSGKVVLAPGDIINALRRYVTSPVTLHVENGSVTRIDGDGLDAALLRGYIESYADDRAYAISHIGWGLNEKAKWHHLAATREADAEIGVHGLAFYGNVLFSMGPNTELGGTNNTACHLDMPLRNCSLFLDNEPIVERGRIVPPEMRAAAAH